MGSFRIYAAAIVITTTTKRRHWVVLQDCECRSLHLSTTFSTHIRLLLKAVFHNLQVEPFLIFGGRNSGMPTSS